MKPWNLSPDAGGVDAPAKTKTAQPWDREGPEDAKAPVATAPVAPSAPVAPTGSLKAEEFPVIFEQTRQLLQARVDADEFERAMRIDFAERRLKKQLEHSDG